MGGGGGLELSTNNCRCEIAPEAVIHHLKLHMHTTEICRDCNEKAQVDRVGDLYDVKCAACGTRYVYHANPATAPLSAAELLPVALRKR